MPRKIKTHNPFPSTFESSPDRKADKKFYKSPLWRKNRTLFLQEHPLCVQCDKEDRLVVAVIVDHIIPRKVYDGDPFDWANLQSLCRSHHSKKTVEEQRRSPSGDAPEK